MSRTFWKVAVAAPLAEALTYHSDDSDDLEIAIGQSVLVPLGRRKIDGVVIHTATEPEEFETKAIMKIQTDFPALTQVQVDWAMWIATYYLYPIGEVLQLLFPPLKILKRKTTKKAVNLNNDFSSDPLWMPSAEPPLTHEQRIIVDKIKAEPPGFSSHLIFGVTGSGKTEIYLQILQDVVAQGKSAIVLVPEISLTPQLSARFSQRFPGQVAIFHSQLTDRQRTDQWFECMQNKKSILIGARSALFCPMPNLKMIILDEEHEASYKQDEKLKYHARDCALQRGFLEKIPVILGSATPSLESYRNVQLKKFQLHTLRERVDNRPLPLVELVDLKQKKRPKELVQLPYPAWMSATLYEALLKTLASGKQAAFFLNRRGISSMSLCVDCGHHFDCPNCDVGLTTHQSDHLLCHYCHYHQHLPTSCPGCGSKKLQSFGFGTEQIEKDMQTYFPEVRCARADRDEIQNRADLETLISDMETQKVDVLIGTQMIAKGLDFPHLNLVGILLADLGMHLPDFRAQEKSLQLFLQMAGRAGRHQAHPGQVIVQTYSMENKIFQFLTSHDYEKFLELESLERAELKYPPFMRMLQIRIQGPDHNEVELTAEKLKSFAVKLKTKFSHFGEVEILGPAPSPLLKVRNQYRFQILLRSTQNFLLQKFYTTLTRDSDWIPTKVRLIPDVDPLHLL